MQGFKDGSRGPGAGTFGDQGRGDAIYIQYSSGGRASRVREAPRLRYLGLGGRAAACRWIDFQEYYIIIMLSFF